MMAFCWLEYIFLPPSFVWIFPLYWHHPSMAKTTTQRPIIAFDMSSLIFEYTPDHSACLIKTANKAILASVEVRPDIPQREAAFLAMEEVLGKVKLRSPEGAWCSIALYNPFTAQFAIDSLPNTIAFGNSTPQPIELEGTYGTLVGGTLVINNSEFAPIDHAYNNIKQALQAHQ